MEKTGITAQKATGSIRNQAIDLMKLILSVFVVMIHAELELGILTPFLRTAVPLFFITSSYFFFRKIEACPAGREKMGVLAAFLKRNMILYGFWFVVLLPVTLYIRNWFSSGLISGIPGFLQSFLFNSTFRASWYIMALNLGMCVTLWLSKRLSCGTQLLITLPAYLVCCLFTNYYGLAERSDALVSAYNGYVSVFRSWSNSYPASLFWLAMGRWFAQNKRNCQTAKLYAVAMVSGAVLLVEYWVVDYYGLSRGNDAYLALVGLCGAVFPLVKSASCSWGADCRFGHISTIIYASHASVITVVGAVVRRVLPPLGSGTNWIVFALSSAACVGICVAVFSLEKYKRFGFLRNAY